LYNVRRLLSGCALLAALVVVPAQGSAQAPGDKRFERWRHFMEERESPGAGSLGVRLQAARRDLLNRFIRAGAPARASTLEVAWEPIGPVGISDFTRSTGRIATIALHPEDPDIIYIGGAQGGVWRTDDGGLSWRPLTDSECSLAMGSVVIDPVDPNIVYAGTGEQHFSADSYYGCGILRSTDGGDTWVRFAPELTRRRVGRIVIDRTTAGSTTTTKLFAATGAGLLRSLDSGANWVKVADGTVTDVAIDPANPMRVWAAVRGSGLIKSTDGGGVFTGLNVFPAGVDVLRVHLAFAPSSPSRIYAAAEDTERGLRLSRSDNSGLTWQQLSATNATCSNQCWYDMALAVDARDPDRVFFGSIRPYRSNDAGVTFTRIGNGAHADQHFIISDPQTPNRVYIANDGGVYRSDDDGSTVQSINNNLALTQFYGGISLHPTSTTTTLGGTQDNGTLLRAAPNVRWDRVVGGDGGFTAIDPTSPNVMYMETQWTGGGGPIKRVDGVARRMVNGIDQSEEALFIPPIAMDPYEPQTLYFGASKLYRTTDAAESWEPLARPDGSPGSSNGRIRSIAAAFSDGNTVYYGTSGRVFVTRNGGVSFSDASNGLPSRSITDLAIHPTDPDVAWAVASGFGSGHVFRTEDGGQSWVDVSGDLPDLPTNAIVLDPTDPEIAYLGTDLGVFAGGAGGSWSWFGEGFPMVAVFDLAVETSTGRLVAGTHGRGMFEVPIAAPLQLVMRPRPPVVDTVAVSGPARPDSLRVGVLGAGWPQAAWTAQVAGNAGWLQIDQPNGQGRDFLRWSTNAVGLPPGLYEDEIVVRLTGSGEEARVPVRIQAFFLVEVQVDRDRTGVSLSVDSVKVFDDSVLVALSGTVLDTTRWVASTGNSTWLELQTVGGASGDVLSWQRNPAGLGEGVFTDSIVVSVEGYPTMRAVVVDTLALLGPLAVQASNPPQAGVSVTGVAVPVADSVAVDFSGFLADDAVWSVANEGSPWFSFVTSQGVGDGFVRWTRTAAGLPAGDQIETMRLTVEGYPELDLEITDTFRVLPALTPDAVGDMLLQGTGLSEDQSRVVDQFGNRDGVVNLGDFLAWLQTCAQSPSACASGGAP
jgi:photosystem II stability/assembly factor-like uncharacterized protein